MFKKEIFKKYRVWIECACAGVLIFILFFLASGNTQPVQEVMVFEPEMATEMTVNLIADENSAPGLPVNLIFSEPIDMESFKENIFFVPYVPYVIVQDGDYSVNIRPERAWNEEQSHTHIIIGTGYVSVNGHSFNTPQILSFLVDSRPYESSVTLEEDKEEYVEEVEEEDVPTVRYLGSTGNYILNNNDNITLVFAAHNLEATIPVIVETYRLPNIARLEQQWHIYRDHDVSLHLLERTDTNVFLLDNGNSYFTLSHQGDGAYIIAVTYTDPFTEAVNHHRSSYIITPLSVYLQASNRDTLAWITSSQPNDVMQGLRIYFGDDTEPTAITNHDGMAFFGNIPVSDEEENTEYDNYASALNNAMRFRIYNQTGELVYFDNGVSQSARGVRERFYSYLFLDRTIYRPEDTINFWGIVQPFRNNERDMPDTVWITFDANGLNLVQELPLNPDGVFNGTIELERIRSAQYSIQASLYFPSEGGEPNGGTHIVLDRKHVSVRDFQKPAFTIESTVDRNFYFSGDDVTVTATIAFFDGTPSPNAMVEVSYFDFGARIWVELDDVETDTNGNAVFSFPAWATGGHVTGGLTRNSYRIRIASDGENIIHTGSYYVFPSDILIDARMQRQEDNENISLLIQTFMLDKESEELKAELEGTNRWLDNNRLLQIAKGEPVDVSNLQISLSWNFFDQNDEQQRHNFHRWIHYFAEDEKTVRSRRMLFAPNYNFRYIVDRNPDVPIWTVVDQSTGERMLAGDTVDGSLIIDDILYLGESYVDWDRPAFSQATIRFNDSLNNTRTGRGFYPNFLDYQEDWGSEALPIIIEGYSMTINNLNSDNDIPAQAGQFNFIQVDIGDTLHFNLMYDSEPIGHEGRILYALIQDGVIRYRMVTGNSFYLQYILDYGPNINLVVVYFDGHNIRPISQTRISANPLSMQFNVDVTTDRDFYAPGDTVNLTVRTTDRDGNGIPANIGLAVVDEAVFAVSEQHIFLWHDFYSDIRFTNNEVWQYFTIWRGAPPSEPYRDGDDNGKDGNANLVFHDNFRSNFRDTAAFLSATTNRFGYAHLTFQLPDNNTSWRITTVAIGNNLMTGQGRNNFISTLPFFVRPVVNTKYIEGDDIAMLVQGHGIVLNANSDVSFVVNITGDDVNETVAFSGLAYVSHELNFGKLPSGSYTLTFQASYGRHTDTIVLPISVIRNNLELVISRAVDFDQNLDIEATRFPVTLTFFDYSAQPFITSLNSLLGHFCMQTNQRMSRIVAKQALRDSMPGATVPSYIAETSENIADMQNADGGIGSDVGSPSDPMITTYVLLASTDGQFDLRAMAEYFRGVLGQPGGVTPMVAALCNLGLAFIGDEAITVEFLTAELQRTSDLAIKAHYIAAIAVLGDIETALALYNRYCAPYMAGTRNERTTAAVWIAATLLGHSDADEIALYFGRMPWRINTLYECMIYVRHFDRIIEPSTLIYTVGGQEYIVQLGAMAIERRQSRFMHTLVLSRSDLESLEFTDIPDNVRATVYYIGEPSEIGLEPSDNMTIDKTIQPIGDYTFEVTINISLDRNAPLGQYDISGWIPSNTRLYDFDRMYQISSGNHVHFRTRHELQNLYISFNRTRQEQQTIIYRYRVRQVFESEAVLDTVYMIHGDTGENAHSVRSVFSTKSDSLF